MQNPDPEFPVVVLLAEDETLVRLLAGDMLTEANYCVVDAPDGQQALAILEAHQTVRALLTDVNMPNLDGLALAKIVHARWPHIGIVVTSGMPKPSGLPDGVRFMSKPFRYETLLHELATVISDTADIQRSGVATSNTE